MEKIMIIGGTGYTGGNIAREAVARGHAVTAVGRSLPDAPIEGVSYWIGSADDVDVTGADVVVATLAARGDAVNRVVELNQRLASAAAQTEARFVVVGGFMSTRPAAGAPRFAETEDIPAEYALEVLSGLETVQWLEAAAPAGLDWLYVSPPQSYGAWVAGERTGTYRKSGDVALTDPDGMTTISGADFALAIVDEIEKPTVHRGQIHFAH